MTEKIKELLEKWNKQAYSMSKEIRNARKADLSLYYKLQSEQTMLKMGCQELEEILKETVSTTDYKVQELTGSKMSRTWEDTTYNLPLGMAQRIYNKYVKDAPDCKFRIIKIEVIKTVIKQT